jgi:two-component system, cell cycle response regulator DivK
MKLKILIIEDNEQNMYMLTYLLEDRFTVFQAFNGIDGINLAMEEQPDVILLDIQLPGMDGYAIAMELRKRDILKNIPIIAVTSYAMVGDKERIMKAGATGYIEKPIDPDVFISQMISFLPDHLIKNISEA